MRERDRDAGHKLVENLLVLDSPENGEVVRTKLAGTGWNVFLAASSGEARYALAKREIDFVVTELILPRETGFELCQHLKQRDQHVPVLVYTEVDLQTARNLAIWSGADGYVVKPVTGDSLRRRIAQVAEASHRRVREARPGEGNVEFRCDCGQSLRVSGDNAGRAAVCPSCGKMVRSPSAPAGSQGVWKMFSEERGKSSRDGAVGFHCERCGKPVHLVQSGRGEVECTHCGTTLRVPDWIRNHARLFFQDERHDDATVADVVEYEPLSFLVVRCDNCSTYYRFDPDVDDAVADCRHCGASQSMPSLRGAPLSRAALTATGRFFEHGSGRQRGKKFLLPRKGSVLVGGADSCQVQVTTAGVAPRHLQLNWLDDRSIATPVPGTRTLLNGQPLEHRVVLRPADELRLGDHRIRLLGNRELSEDVLLESVVQKRSESGRDALKGASDVADQAARVIQLHWERQRERRRSAGTLGTRRRRATAARPPAPEPTASSVVPAPVPKDFVSGRFVQPTLDPTHPAYDPSQAPAAPPAPPSAPPPTPPSTPPPAPPVRSGGSSGTEPLPLNLPNPDEVGPKDQRDAASGRSGSRNRRIRRDESEVVETAKDLISRMTGREDE